MRKVLFWAEKYKKEDIALALESGVDGLIVPDAELKSVSSMARCEVLPETHVTAISLKTQEDEKRATELLAKGNFVILKKGWEIIPVENLLAQMQKFEKEKTEKLNEKKTEKTEKQAKLTPDFPCLALEVCNAEEAKLATAILEKGVEAVLVFPESLGQIKSIVSALKESAQNMVLDEAVITEIRPVGMGHRACVDTLSILEKGQGMLVGNSSSFTFLVNAETEHNEYVASRPFRINAGAVHSYAQMLHDKTSYLEELKAGMEVMIVNEKGDSHSAVVGRVKIEQRPMLLIKAETADKKGTVFLQNAETIRLVQPDGHPKSVVELKVGDKILCHLDSAGRHFGMRITEDILED